MNKETEQILLRREAMQIAIQLPPDPGKAREILRYVAEQLEFLEQTRPPAVRLIS